MDILSKALGLKVKRVDKERKYFRTVMYMRDVFKMINVMVRVN